MLTIFQSFQREFGVKYFWERHWPACRVTICSSRGPRGVCGTSLWFKPQTSHLEVRVSSAQWGETDGGTWISITADSFTHQTVRELRGALMSQRKKKGKRKGLPVVAVVLIDSYYASRSWNKPVMKLFFFRFLVALIQGRLSYLKAGDVFVLILAQHTPFFFPSQVPHPSDWHLRHRARLQPWGVRHAARLQNQLGLLEPPRPAVHDHVPYVRFHFSPVRARHDAMCNPLWAKADCSSLCVPARLWTHKPSRELAQNSCARADA